MKILLDENFPPPLYHRLRSSGYDVEHIIALGQRGLADSAIIERLAREDLVFLTSDREFMSAAAGLRGKIIVSRVSQNLPIVRRVEIWFAALQVFQGQQPAGHVFELLDTGEVVPWQLKGGTT